MKPWNWTPCPFCSSIWSRSLYYRLLLSLSQTPFPPPLPIFPLHLFIFRLHSWLCLNSWVMVLLRLASELCWRQRTAHTPPRVVFAFQAAHRALRPQRLRLHKASVLPYCSEHLQVPSTSLLIFCSWNKCYKFSKMGLCGIWTIKLWLTCYFANCACFSSILTDLQLNPKPELLLIWLSRPWI